MSYDIYLKDPVTGERLYAARCHTLRGGTYQMDGGTPESEGTRELWLNITYNYGVHYRRVLGEGGIRTIYGVNALDSIPVLRKAADQLGTNVSRDYWEPTEGNARKALEDLMVLATMAPHGVWDGD